jgi:hypothetical protein
MPAWTVVVVSFAAFVLAVGVIWTKFLKPVAKVITQAGELAPLVPVMQEIAREFKNNGGSTLLDKIERIEAAIESVRVAASVAANQATDAAIKAEVQSTLAMARERQVEHLVRTMHRLEATMVVGTASTLRMEDDRVQVAEHLAAKEHEADTTEGPEGAAADAGAKTPPAVT